MDTANSEGRKLIFCRADDEEQCGGMKTHADEKLYWVSFFFSSSPSPPPLTLYQAACSGELKECLPLESHKRMLPLAKKKKSIFIIIIMTEFN